MIFMNYKRFFLNLPFHASPHSPLRFTPTAHPLIWQHPQDNSHISSLENKDSGTLSEFAVHWKGTKGAENRSLWWTIDYDGEVSKHSRSRSLPTCLLQQHSLSYTAANWTQIPKTSSRWVVILLDLYFFFLNTAKCESWSFQFKYSKNELHFHKCIIIFAYSCYFWHYYIHFFIGNPYIFT